jgi:glyoxylase-like metal-dependent hydrolase (beta-lactamase superfamily II)
VYLVPGVRGANSYLFLGKEGVVVVDTGMGGNASRIVEFAGRLGKQPTPIAYIVLTHSDFDHSGSVAQLSARALNMDQAKESVRKISELKFENLLPGHGPPITSNASAKLKGFVKNDFKNA